MRLRFPNQEPIGGWKYGFKDQDDNIFTVKGDSLIDLVKNVKEEMTANRIPIPSNIRSYIEDQICMKQPKGKCLYDGGLGDIAALGAHTFLGAIDGVAKKLGVKTQLRKKAQGCSGCASRRMALNGRN